MIEHPRLNWVGTLVGLLILTAAALGREDTEQLLATARDGNRAAIQSIASMECRYERQPWANTSLEQANKCFALFSPGRFWRSGDVYRLLKPMGDGTTLDDVVRNGKGLYLRKGGPLNRPILVYESLRPVDGIGGDMWQWLIFSHWGWDPPSFYPLQDIIEHTHVIRKAERLPTPANDIHIELTHSGGRLEFWLDPKVNYLIRKRVVAPAADSTYRWEDEVVEFAEPSPTVFVPVVIEHRFTIKGTLQAIVRTILSEVKVNQPLAESALRIPGIAGMECFDMNRDVKYNVDADGTATGPEISVKIAKVTPPAETGSILSSEASNSFQQPSRPSTPWWLWLLLMSLTVLAAALILILIRRRRRAVQT